MSLHQKPRRGVLLLVVLSLLVLFVLAGTTFLIVSGQYRRSSSRMAKIERLADMPDDMMDSSIKLLLRGTATNNVSPIDRHAILRDLYGAEYVIGAVSDATSIPPPPTLPSPRFDAPDIPSQPGQLTIFHSYVDTTIIPPLPPAEIVSRGSGFYNGGVVTMVSGDHAGQSRRIIEYEEIGAPPAPYWRRLVVESFGFALPKGGDRYVINGLPFNGTGAGMIFDGANFTMNTLVTFPGTSNPYPSAILPNYYGSPDPALGGMDESYDAADFQNMFLAWVPVTEDATHRIIPSFHRPSIVNYIANLEGGIDTTAQRDLWRAVFMRPVPFGLVNQNFTGSNPSFDPIEGPWDVDNDGDGVHDSVWLDLGFPAQTDSTGIFQKPLFAFMCVDLDGRLNLNVHGNLAHLEDIFINNVPTGGIAAGGTATLPGHPRGEGYGPAEVFLGAALAELTPALQRDAMRAIFEGRVGLFEGRYGQEGVPFAVPRPGFDGADDDAFFPWKHGSVPFDFFAPPPTIYSSRPDLRGLLATYIDHAGQARMEDGDGVAGQTVISTGPISESVDDPYELNVVASNGTDTPFGTDEMEALLRGYDASLRPVTSRLVTSGLFNNTPATAYRRKIFTTRSFSNPAPIVMPFDPTLRANVFNGLFTAVTGSPSTNIRNLFLEAGFTPMAVDQALAFELAHGERLNVNRLFGDGVDNNGNGVVDEPGENNDTQITSGGQTVQDGMVAQFSNVPPPIPAQAPFRQLLARHLYCLMYALWSQQTINLDLDPGGIVDHQRALAQWAINVVDYRDPDAIMTPFEYDLDPSDGWTPTGDIVWGMERPELLITETLAFHDRRKEDLVDYGLWNPGLGDPSFDQRLAPVGRLFIELYNPWIESANLDSLTTTTLSRNDVTSHPPAEFYRLSTDGRHEGLALYARSRVGNSPIWRILISQTAGDGSLNFSTATPTLFDDLDATGTPPVPQIERSIYFTRPPVPPIGAVQYYPSQNPTVLKPGRYAVIGSGDYDATLGRYVATLGRRTTATDTSPLTNQTRRIVLRPGNNPNQNQVTRFTGNDPTVEVTSVDGNVQPAIAVAIDRVTPTAPARTPRRGLNISEPTDGYPAYNDPGGKPEYNPPLDVPLDTQSGVFLQAEIGTSDDLLLGFRSVILQRLANPLVPYNATTNPYITIDWQAANLQLFNGIDQDDPQGGTPKPRSFERGVTGKPFWAHQEPLTGAPIGLPGNPTYPHVFDFQLPNTLGFLNESYSAIRNSGVGHPAYAGQPDSAASTFPWINWRNKPYVTHYELLSVPKSAAWHFPLDFSVNQTGTFSEYEYAFGNPNLSYRHLFPIRSRLSGSGQDHGLYQLMDLIEVPDRFAGTELWGNPDDFATAATGGFRPPFHRISRFRVPGRVNINTIPDTVSESRVWNAVVAAGGGPAWSDVENSRRGYAVPVAGLYPHLDPLLPTQFAAPFRSSALADLVPPPILQQDGVDAGLLRAGFGGTEVPLFASYDSTPYRNGNINPYFRNLPVQRLGNIISFHSNVFAVWVTVGFFEFDETRGLGKEVGSDTGQIKRHRSFYIIDRSIPVAYEPGQDHNVEDTIILRRRLE